ncbi:hypothetical protein M9H77_26233 [Catharanthus roseus]|uniref:Uncharacterized protein n=1 Tax=Catharanthus roseus TaxID=4058 RepID=A0ACC0AAX8_CATRO|nr:hypothetical protein M9H77_26233 [Catharanthus roseus]
MWTTKVVPLPLGYAVPPNLPFSGTTTNNYRRKLVGLRSNHNQLKSPIQQLDNFPTTGIRCSSSPTSQGASAEDNFSAKTQNNQQNKGFFKKWKENSAEMSAKLAKLGLAAVLAYGLFDGVTYTSFFVLAFVGYEKSTGKNPAANLQALLGIVILMWTGNNITRPFRVAGAAALAPIIDKGLRRIQKHFNFPSLVYAFALVVAIVAGSCFTVVGLLILSRWGK